MATCTSRCIARCAHLIGFIDFVEFQYSELHSLLLVLDLLRLGICFLLAPFATTTHFQHKMKGRFLLDVVILKGTTIFELFTREDQTLLIRWNALFILDLSLHGFNCVGAFNLESNSFPCECLHKDLHVSRSPCTLR